MDDYIVGSVAYNYSVPADIHMAAIICRAWGLERLMHIVHLGHVQRKIRKQLSRLIKEKR